MRLVVSARSVRSARWPFSTHARTTGPARWSFDFELAVAPIGCFNTSGRREAGPRSQVSSCARDDKSSGVTHSIGCHRAWRFATHREGTESHATRRVSGNLAWAPQCREVSIEAR